MTEKKSTRLETLLAIEQSQQARWATEAPYEAEVKEGAEKFFINFPYPYMNGMLHLGHGFSMTKCEFAARYQRLKGRNVLFPFGLHVTGTPIAACAQKLVNEMRKYGNPPVFPSELLEKPKEEKKELAPGKHVGKKAKAAPPLPQWIIMRGMGISDADIEKFADPQHWLDHFPPLALRDLKKFGAHIDFRRSFLTTNRNPFYDSFIRWQFRQLRAKGLLGFGKRYCVYSPLDGQPCADHDRASGEGVQPQEYCVVKLRVQDVDTHEAFKPHIDKIASRAVVLAAATMRSETVVGQTNAWVSPTVTYGAFEVQSSTGESQIMILTSRAARNMAYQDYVVNGKSWSTPDALFEVHGSKLIGLPLSAPHAPFKTIFTLPMDTITETKGTGVVMSVPSDSPDDYINFIQYFNKPEYRAKLGLKDEWVVPFNIVPIIEIPGELGSMSAKVACEMLKVQGPKDAANLEQAKEMVYKGGFYQGVMSTGPFKGKKVAEAKVLMMKTMVADGDAIIYYEPMKQVTSRSGDECVVARCEQWFIEYGKEEWKALVVDHVKNTLYTYFPGIHNCFVETLDWLSDWPCSRTFGLGTNLPFDDAVGQLIDSLSDSTIYMAYYIIAKYVHSSTDGELNLDGRRPNAYGITPEMMVDKTWDFIFHGKGTAEEVHAATGLPVEVANAMRGEFNYFYPVDLRSSGKDLIQNHLTMFLYNHAAIWENDRSKWPRSIFCNGHILVDGEKMSKSKGNFITLDQAMGTYGTDALRLALADAGDSLDDANFVRETASNFILKLTTLIELFKERVATLPTLRTGEFSLYDKIFENALNHAIIEADGHFSKMSFRSALNLIFFELQNEESQYKLMCGSAPMHADLVKRYLEAFTLLIAPLAPHTAEHLWRDVLGQSESINRASFPVPSRPVDATIQMISRMLTDVTHEIRAQAAKVGKKRTINEVVIYVAGGYETWQREGLKVLATMFKDGNGEISKDAIKSIVAAKYPWMAGGNIPEMMAFLAFAKQNAERFGAVVLSETPLIDDNKVLNEALGFIAGHTGIEKVSIRSKDDASVPEHANTRSKARPGEPTIAFL